MAIEVYRPGQGVRARIGTGLALVVLAIFAAYRLYQLLPSERTFFVIGLQLPYASLWAALLFVVEAAVIAYFLAGPDFGGAFFRKKCRSFIDLLVDTELELGKVVWPTREDLVSSTVIVITAIILLGIFVLGVDSVLSEVLRVLKVLPS